MHSPKIKGVYNSISLAELKGPHLTPDVKTSLAPKN